MEIRKVTSDALRAMRMGGTALFDLPADETAQQAAVESGRVIAYRLQRELRCKFITSADYENRHLVITKIPR